MMLPVILVGEEETNVLLVLFCDRVREVRE